MVSHSPTMQSKSAAGSLPCRILLSRIVEDAEFLSAQARHTHAFESAASTGHSVNEVSLLLR